MEERFLINGGKKLCGQIKVEGSKNALLPILSACVLSDDEVILKNCNRISDVQCMIEILEQLKIDVKSDDDTICLDVKKNENAKITHEFTQKVRASIFILGALLGKFRSAVVAYPGGCKIGTRPIDIHIKSFKTLGVKIVEKHGYIYCNGQNMKAGDVVFDFPSVGATESLMMCATLLKGKTTLKNVAKEPEIVDLQNFLNSMGAKVCGAGTNEIVIEGVSKLHGTEFAVMPDRIVAGTYLLACATCGGDVTVDGAILKHNESLVSFLKQTACQIETFNDKIRLKVNKRLSSFSKVETMPFPFFPTDLQSQMMVFQSVSDGVCLIQENLFESRFGLVPELKKMGADIVVNGKTALVKGVEKLYGADVHASDLRAGASLVIAGMVAEGYTTVYNVNYIDRGYNKIEEKYNLLGADIKRIKIE